MFQQFVSQTGNFNKLLQAIKNRENISVFGLTSNEQTSLFWETDAFLFFVTSGVEHANQLKEKLEGLHKRCAILTQNFSYDATNLNNETYETNLQTLLQAGKKYDVILITPNVLLNKYPVQKNTELVLQIEQQYDLSTLQKQLVSLGYTRQELAEEPANFAVRGDVVDIVPIDSLLGYRLSFFGNDLEFIKPYDLATQLLVKQEEEQTSLQVYQKTTNKITRQQITNAKSQIAKQINILTSETAKQQLQEIEGLLETSNMQTSHWADVFSATQNVFSFLPQNSTIVFHEPKQILDELHAMTNEYAEQLKQDILLGYALPVHKQFYETVAELFSFKDTKGLITFGNITTSNRIFAPQKVFSFKCATLLNYAFHKKSLVYDVKQFFNMNFTQLLFTGTKELAQNLQSVFLAEGIKSNIVSNAARAQAGSINLVTIPRNVTLGILEEKLIVIGTNQLQAKPKARQSIDKQSVVNFAELLPNVGDFVVHETHGIGRCVDVTSLEVGNTKKDYVVLEYKNKDRLYLPVEHLDSVSKYLGGEAHPKLNKLGGAEFFNTKQKVKGQLKETAFSLVELYAKRQEQKGIVFPQDDEFQSLFEAEFAYTETPDQMQAILDVKSDMQSPKIMDRLICGDVGYGKTEVALRAIFKAVNAGYQTAFLCPTTILSQQHYNTCLARMQSFGVTVEVLNRFKTKAEQKQILQRLQDGQVQVLIGTHRLLSADVKFKNLGLLVLDEEQKFGVADKEKIKAMKEHIDVLTLSATPIPRSLHMALAGIRDISIIETPPPLKLPVVTQVLEYRDELLQFATKQELKRGGQVLVVYNNIAQIYSVKEKVQRLFGKSVSVSVAHGQMSEKQLENEIYNLYNGTTQVLISTTLIENGIDLPTANTLFVINSDGLGLSQLYQLKGRVGRAGVQAFAYFTYDHSKFLNQNAVKRLEAISEFTSLGDGYKIAMRDLEIRGAGNVLGVEQSGHMQKVGYAMYVSLLKEAVQEIKGEVVTRNWEVQVSSMLPANLPEFYISDQARRMKLYGDLAKIETEQQFNQFVKNTGQVFGEMPKELRHLAQIAWLKNVAKQLPIKRATFGYDNLELTFYAGEPSVPNLVANFISQFAEFVELDPNNQYILKLTGQENRVQFILLLTKFLSFANKNGKD